jgi:hypothetical protein
VEVNIETRFGGNDDQHDWNVTEKKKGLFDRNMARKHVMG